jgi:NTP pyrophosphatase (non-canonical NTP hydrolase)
MNETPSDGLTLKAIQTMILQLYGWKDAARGDTATFLWLAEEVGELAAALRAGSQEELAREMADVLAWLVTLANVRGIDLAAAFQAKYGGGCPACHAIPCVCDPSEKP